MAKDDYQVIVYQLLSYLYQCLKHGERPSTQFISYDGALFHIHPDYWRFIIISLLEDGLIGGVVVAQT